eukprot:2331114-Amphidinium_carterae.2
MGREAQDTVKDRRLVEFEHNSLQRCGTTVRTKVITSRSLILLTGMCHTWHRPLIPSSGVSESLAEQANHAANVLSICEAQNPHFATTNLQQHARVPLVYQCH